MSTEESHQCSSIYHVVSLVDVVKFKVALHKIAMEEEDDLERFTHPLDDAIVKKAYYRLDAIRQCLTLLDQMVLHKAFGQSPKAPISRPAESE